MNGEINCQMQATNFPVAMGKKFIIVINLMVIVVQTKKELQIIQLGHAHNK